MELRYKIIIFLSVMILCGCTNLNAKFDTSQPISQYMAITEKDETSEEIGLSINGYYLTLYPNKDETWIEPMSMAADAPNYFKFNAFSGYTIKVNGQEVESDGTIEVKIDGSDGLKKSVGIPIEFCNIKTEEVTRQYVRCLNQGFPEIITVNNGADDGYYYFEPTLDWIAKMSTDSEIMYYKYCEDNLYDFRPFETESGELYYGYRTPYANEDQRLFVVSSSLTECKQVIMDSNYQVIKEIYGTLDDFGKFTNTALDSHEFLLFDKDHYITLSYVPTYVYNIPQEFKSRGQFPSRVMSALIQEVKDEKVIFEWRSTDYPELYGMSVEGNKYDFSEGDWCDYIHVNSIDICPNDNNLVISMRNADSIVEIHRRTGNIEWVLGGKMDMFGLTENQKTARQHFARFTEDGTLTVFDNSTNYMVTEKSEYVGNGTGYPRIVEYQLNERELELGDFNTYEYKIPQSEIMGSATKLSNDGFIVGWGGSIKVPCKMLFSEIDFYNQKVLFEATNKTGSNMTYRVYKYQR